MRERVSVSPVTIINIALCVSRNIPSPAPLVHQIDSIRTPKTHIFQNDGRYRKNLLSLPINYIVILCHKRRVTDAITTYFT